MPTAAGHPVFARLYGVLAALGERSTLGRWRTEVLAGARGRLLVVGLGPGHDLAHLPAAVTAVVAVEPDPTMRAAAARRVAGTAVPVELLDAPAERLPLPDGSVDAVLFSLVLCSVDDVDAALREARRVLRPDGTVHVLEHVRAAEGSRLAGAQRRLSGFWQRLAGGCHPDRDTRAAFERAGLPTADLVDVPLRLGVPLCRPHLRGTVRP